MKKLLVNHKIFWSVSFGSLLAGLLYILTVTPLFKASSSAVILRTQLDHPDWYSPNIRERFVWVRDGLAAQSYLLNDDYLLSLLKKFPQLQERFLKFHSNLKNQISGRRISEGDAQLLFIQEFRKGLEVQFTGGDEFRFIFQVKDPSPELAVGLAQDLLGRLKEVTSEHRRSLFQGAVERMESRLTELRRVLGENGEAEKKALAEEYDRGLEMLGKLKVAQDIELAQEEAVFQIVERPKIPLHPFWPMKKLILILALFFGMTWGAAWEYLLYLKDRRT